MLFFHTVDEDIHLQCLKYNNINVVHSNLHILSFNLKMNEVNT